MERGSGKVFANLLQEMADRYLQFRSGEILQKLLISSFEESELTVVKEAFPKMETAFLEKKFQLPLYTVDRKKLDRLKRLGVEAVHLSRRKATVELVDYLKYHHGFAVRVYTVNDSDSLFRYFEMGVDGVFTDRAEALTWMGAVGVAKKPASQSVSV